MTNRETLRSLADDRFKIKMWRVACEGFSAHLYYATSRGKALRDAWWDYCNYRPVSFKEFLRIARSWREWPVDGDAFGQPITVNDKPAFFVTRNNQYVRFAWPDSDEIGNIHPYEVLPEHMRPWTYREPAASLRAIGEGL